MDEHNKITKLFNISLKSVRRKDKYNIKTTTKLKKLISFNTLLIIMFYIVHILIYYTNVLMYYIL